MSELRYESLPEGAVTLSEDILWARSRPEYWGERLKLEVADVVIAELKRRHMSRAELARRMGTSPAFVTKILRGHHNWSLETLAKAGVALHLAWTVSSTPLNAQATVGDPAAVSGHPIDHSESAPSLLRR